MFSAYGCVGNTCLWHDFTTYLWPEGVQHQPAQQQEECQAEGEGDDEAKPKAGACTIDGLPAGMAPRGHRLEGR